MQPSYINLLDHGTLVGELGSNEVYLLDGKLYQAEEIHAPELGYKYIVFAVTEADHERIQFTARS